MSNRVTRKQLDTLMSYVAKGLSLPHGHYAQDLNGKYHAVMGALDLDHNTCYGGYQVEQITSTGGGISVISGDRKSAREMYAWLQGALSYHRMSEG